MKKIWLVLILIASLYSSPFARAGGYACGGWGGCYGGGGCYSGGWFGGLGLGLGVGLYGGDCGWGLSLGIGLPGLWAGIGFGGCGPVYANPAYVGPTYTTPGHVDNPPPVPMSAAQMAGHNTRDWTPPPGQTTGPTYYWTAPPSAGS